ncbi:hypothetical protein [Phenylobacterium sp. J367]|uniref:hypothetical protein n=1 Tax=Phenylobacterium sp. J367 TaxID=2898435 RepID=UPI0021510864|nr:hypothetical protein [Phenylobacterium sp. J367]MCR5878924.1 hypothetical protein [Phenylobacterium sp. J367]
MSAQARLALVPVAGAQDGAYLVRGSDLASVRVARTLKVGLNDKGVITSINSANNDRSTAVVGNVLTAAAKLAPLIAGLEATKTPSPCTEAIQQALARRDGIRNQMFSVRKVLNTSPATTPTAAERQHRKDLEALAKELEQVAPLLTVDLPARIKVTPDVLDDPAAPLAFDTTPLDAWFGPAAKATAASQFAVMWTARLAQPASETPITGAKPKSLRACGLALAVPKTGAVGIRLDATGPGYAKVDGKAPSTDLALDAAQVATPAQLCIDAGFGENRTIDLAWDDFGRLKSYNWSHQAQAETVSGMVAGAAPNVATLWDTLDGKTQLEQDKAELDRLNTEAALAKARACKAVRDAGGTCS